MKLDYAEEPSFTRDIYPGMTDCCYSKDIITKRDTVSRGFVLGEPREGKECVLVKLSYEDYIQLKKYCEKHDFYYCISFKSGDVVVVSLEKKIWKKFNSLLHKLFKLFNKKIIV